MLDGGRDQAEGLREALAAQLPAPPTLLAINEVLQAMASAEIAQKGGAA